MSNLELNGGAPNECGEEGHGFWDSEYQRPLWSIPDVIVPIEEDDRQITVRINLPVSGESERAAFNWMRDHIIGLCRAVICDFKFSCHLLRDHPELASENWRDVWNEESENEYNDLSQLAMETEL